MKKINVIIIDDEPAAVEVLTELTAQLTNDLFIKGVATNGLDAMQLILEHKPDLVFLDVNLPLMNGLELVAKLPFKSFHIIFTTGTAAHALDAIKLEATDYLLKPIDPAEFMIAIEKVRTKASPLNNSPTGLVPKLHLPTLDEIVYVKESDILHIVGKGSYCQIHLLSQEKITVSKSIGQMEEKLSPSFFRCHNSHLINLNYINSFMRKDGYQIQLTNGVIVEVSRRNKDALLKRLEELTK